jgi:hypothetical protein
MNGLIVNNASEQFRIRRCSAAVLVDVLTGAA